MKKLLLVSFSLFLVSSASAVKWSVNNSTGSENYQFHMDEMEEVHSNRPGFQKFVTKENVYSNPRFRLVLGLNEESTSDEELTALLSKLPPAQYLNKKGGSQVIKVGDENIPGLTIYTSMDKDVFAKNLNPKGKNPISSKTAVMSKIMFPQSLVLTSDAEITVNFHGFAPLQKVSDENIPFLPLFDVNINLGAGEVKNFKQWLPTIHFDGIDHFSKLGKQQPIPLEKYPEIVRPTLQKHFNRKIDFLAGIVTHLNPHVSDLRATSKMFRDYFPQVKKINLTLKKSPLFKEKDMSWFCFTTQLKGLTHGSSEVSSNKCLTHFQNIGTYKIGGIHQTIFPENEDHKDTIYYPPIWSTLIVSPSLLINNSRFTYTLPPLTFDLTQNDVDAIELSIEEKDGQNSVDSPPFELKVSTKK